MFDVDNGLAKELSRTHGVNPLFLMELVKHYGPEQKPDALKFLLEEKNMSTSLAEKLIQCFGAYWHRYRSEQRRRKSIF
ncbi:MAG: hypothetical protein HY558_02845 [Euryarchaeota archaeon]|nr:hypothetical protein [Euryarchaeota archaeon]